MMGLVLLLADDRPTLLVGLAVIFLWLVVIELGRVVLELLL